MYFSEHEHICRRICTYLTEPYLVGCESSGAAFNRETIRLVIFVAIKPWYVLLLSIRIQDTRAARAQQSACV